VPRTIPHDRFGDLLDAATAVFIAQGYRRTQIADVAARLGLAKGSIYTYVDSKEALFEAALRHADRPRPIPLPEKLPVSASDPQAILRMIEKRVSEEATLPKLTDALARKRVVDIAAELESVLGEVFDLLLRHRTVIKLIDRCALDRPQLADLWYRAGRVGAMSRIAEYLADRTRRGRVRRFPDDAIATRLVLETLVFWAVHRHWDPSPQPMRDEDARETVLAFLVAALAAK